MGRQTDRQTNRKTFRQKDRKTSSQTDVTASQTKNYTYYRQKENLYRRRDSNQRPERCICSLSPLRHIKLHRNLIESLLFKYFNPISDCPPCKRKLICCPFLKKIYRK
jgi:hypothetical protein